jgi:cell wall-associated NlpC family hydrolase
VAEAYYIVIKILRRVLMYYKLKPFRQNAYNRESAVNYAVKYALTPNSEYRYFPLIKDNSGDCANFVSQCLKAGGATMSHNPGSMWWYDNHGTLNKKDDTWSVSWTVAHSLYWYLKTNKSIYSGGLKGFEVNDLNRLQLGDVVFYEDYKSIIFHSAIITSFINVNETREPLISQHSFERLNIGYKKSYPYKRVHFLKISII